MFSALLLLFRRRQAPAMAVTPGRRRAIAQPSQRQAVPVAGRVAVAVAARRHVEVVPL